LEERRERVKENKLFFFVGREREMGEIIRKWGARVVGNI
jgi:hypothetical protein